MATKYTTNAIVLNACAGFATDMTTAVIDEYINQNEAYVDAYILRNTSFSFSTSKQGHLLIRKLVTYMTVMDVALANISKNSLDTVRTAYDAANDAYQKLMKALQEASVSNFIQEQ